MSKKTGLIVFILMLVMAFFAYWYWRPQPEQPNYITATATIKDIEDTVLAVGKLTAKHTVNVGAQVSGEVTHLYVDVGDKVAKGDVIAQIDATTQHNDLDNKRANLEQMQAQLTSQKATLELSETKLRRLTPLLDTQAISIQEYDVAVNEVARAQAAVQTAQAQLKQAQAQVDTAEQNVGYTRIIAPIEGTVVSVITKEGQTLNAMQSVPTIVVLADLETIRVKARISEADVIRLQAGMPVYFTVLGAPERRFDAVLTAIEPAPEVISNTTDTSSAVYYIGYFDVPNPNGILRIDMTAQVYIVLDKANDALTVPAAAIKRQDKHAYVTRVLADGTTEQAQVEVGINNRIDAQIVAGLSKGDKVVIASDMTDDDSDMRRQGKRMRP